MLLDPGHHLGDAWFAVDGEVVHACYLRCPDHVERHTRWEIARATSRDLVHWERHGPVLAAEDGEPCLATGSVLPDGDGWLLAFTIGWAEARPHIGMARSRDLMRWERDGEGPTIPAAPSPFARDAAPSARPTTHWRDPFLRRRPDGTLEVLLCAARADAPTDRSGTVAVARRTDGARWSVLGPIDVEPVAQELECPQVVEVDGSWFLVFSTWPALFSSELRAAHGDRLRPGAYAMTGPGPDGPFRFTDPEPIVPPTHPQQPYAGQVVQFQGRHHLLGTLWRAGQPDALSDPIPLRARGGRLVAEG